MTAAPRALVAALTIALAAGAAIYWNDRHLTGVHAMAVTAALIALVAFATRRAALAGAYRRRARRVRSGRRAHQAAAHGLYPSRMGFVRHSALALFNRRCRARVSFRNRHRRAGDRHHHRGANPPLSRVAERSAHTCACRLHCAVHRRRRDRPHRRRAAPHAVHVSRPPCSSFYSSWPEALKRWRAGS